MSVLNARRPPQGPVIDVDAQKWRSAVFAGGGTVTALHHARVTRLIRALKAGGVWSSLERLHVAGENFTQFNTDLVSRATGTNSGATYTASSGIKGNGSTTYWNSGYNVSTGTLFTQNAGHWGVWQNVAKTTGADGNHGAITNPPVDGTYIDFSAGANAAVARVNAQSGAAFTVTSGIGHAIANRTASNSLSSWYNGSKINTNAIASTTPVNLTLWIGGRNLSGSINQPSDAQVFACHVGGSLSDAQALALYNALSTYKTAIGA